MGLSTRWSCWVLTPMQSFVIIAFLFSSAMAMALSIYRTLCVLVSKQLFKEYPEHGYYHSHLHLKMNKNYLNAIFSCDKKTEAGHLLLLKAKNIKFISSCCSDPKDSDLTVAYNLLLQMLSRLLFRQFRHYNPDQGVSQKHFFQKKKIGRYPHIPLWGIYKPDPKYFCPSSSLRGQTTLAKMRGFYTVDFHSACT